MAGSSIIMGATCNHTSALICAFFKQWGRVHKDAEGRTGRMAAAGTVNASMGPCL